MCHLPVIGLFDLRLMICRALVLRRAQAEKERVAYDAIPEADRDVCFVYAVTGPFSDRS